VVAGAVGEDNGRPLSVSRIHFRPPGVKTGSKIGPFGPFRGRLGIQWVIGSIAAGVLIVMSVTWGLTHAGKPDEPFRSIGSLESFAPGSAREVLGGVFLGRTDDGRPFAVAEPANCPLEVSRRGYVDCLNIVYTLDGQALGKGEPLSLLPLQVYRGEIFIDAGGGA
jgi:hypothetical protein